MYKSGTSLSELFIDLDIARDWDFILDTFSRLLEILRDRNLLKGGVYSLRVCPG